MCSLVVSGDPVVHFEINSGASSFGGKFSRKLKPGQMKVTFLKLNER